nr:MAG TPA: hypothetical protein [Caudoviricetes sp.]
MMVQTFFTVKKQIHKFAEQLFHTVLKFTTVFYRQNVILTNCYFFQISYSTIRFGVVKYVYHTKEGDFT